MDSRQAVEPRACITLCLAEIDTALDALWMRGEAKHPGGVTQHPMDSPLARKFQVMRAALIKQGGATVPALSGV